MPNELDRVPRGEVTPEAFERHATFVTSKLFRIEGLSFPRFILTDCFSCQSRKEIWRLGEQLVLSALSLQFCKHPGSECVLLRFRKFGCLCDGPFENLAHALNCSWFRASGKTSDRRFIADLHEVTRMSLSIRR